jgi:two-component system LytT family response regulator
MINCIIVDDEPKNIKLLQAMLQMYCPTVQIIATESKSKNAVHLIQDLQPDLVFLDVEMPHLNGFDLLKKLQPASFQTIFVTAFSHYAIDAIELQATGYLTKPINAEKLMAAVNIAAKHLSEKNITQHLNIQLEQRNKQPIPDKIPLSTSNGIVFIKLTDIMYCESCGNYTSFYLCDEKKMLISRQLGEYEKLLPETDFIRLHDKYLVHLFFIKEYIKGSGGEVLLENGKLIPVATRRKEEFLSRFDKWLKRKG